MYLHNFRGRDPLLCDGASGNGDSTGTPTDQRPPPPPPSYLDDDEHALLQQWLISGILDDDDDDTAVIDQPSCTPAEVMTANRQKILGKRPRSACCPLRPGHAFALLPSQNGLFIPTRYDPDASNGLMPGYDSRIPLPSNKWYIQDSLPSFSGHHLVIEVGPKSESVIKYQKSCESQIDNMSKEQLFSGRSNEQRGTSLACTRLFNRFARTRHTPPTLCKWCSFPHCTSQALRMHRKWVHKRARKTWMRQPKNPRMVKPAKEKRAKYPSQGFVEQNSEWKSAH
jgi:hypothetical protein